MIAIYRSVSVHLRNAIVQLRFHIFGRSNFGHSKVLVPPLDFETEPYNATVIDYSHFHFQSQKRPRDAVRTEPENHLDETLKYPLKIGVRHESE